MHSIKTKDSNGYLRKRSSSLMKISLFYKHWMTKACFSLAIIVSMLGMPHMAYAGFLSFMGGLLGSATKNAEAIVPVNTEDTAVKNSQTVSLLVPIINVNQNSSKDAVSINIVEDQALESKISPLGTDTDLEDSVYSSAPINTYVVKKGDTLDEIAGKFNVSKDTILYSNPDIKGSIKAGQTLVIIPIKGIVYTVKTGDTLSSISKKYNASLESIKNYNDVSKPSDLKVGDIIVLPGGKAPKQIAQAPIKEEKVKVQSLPIAEPNVVNTDQETIPTIPETPNIKPESVPSNGFIWPLPAGTSSISQELHGANGVDFRVPTGTPIYAIASGTILIADGVGWNGGYGGYVVINLDDGTQLLYGHMSQVTVPAGKKVNQGDIVGRSGSTGHSTGPHLHLERRGGTNPYRNLPLGAKNL